MIKIEKTEVFGWGAAIRGLRNPMNSWDRSDSSYCGAITNDDCDKIEECFKDYCIGPNDMDLAQRLSRNGDVHAKYLRMIAVWADINAPLYWWKEYDTYKVGTVANSCSTMHKVMSEAFTPGMFSTDKMDYFVKGQMTEVIIPLLNTIRDRYLREQDPEKKKTYWYDLIQLLPESWNQKRTVMLNYQVLKSMYWSRKDHKLDEWREFCAWCEDKLPYFKELCIEPYLVE